MIDSSILFVLSLLSAQEQGGEYKNLTEVQKDFVCLNAVLLEIFCFKQTVTVLRVNSSGYAYRFPLLFLSFNVCWFTTYYIKSYS